MVKHFQVMLFRLSGFRLDGVWVMMLVVGSKREREREREAMSEKIKKNGKRMNILLNKCVEKID